MPDTIENGTPVKVNNFIHDIIDEELAEGA